MAGDGRDRPNTRCSPNINLKYPSSLMCSSVRPVAAAWWFATNCAAVLSAVSTMEGAMPTYIVGDIHITDPAAYQTHVPAALATIARFGGRVVAGGGKIDLLEGGPMPERIFIIEFPTADAARNWYRSEEDQAALKVRQLAAQGRGFVIEGSEISAAAPVAGLDA